MWTCGTLKKKIVKDFALPHDHKTIFYNMYIVLLICRASRRKINNFCLCRLQKI